MTEDLSARALSVGVFEVACVCLSPATPVLSLEQGGGCWTGSVSVPLHVVWWQQLHRDVQSCHSLSWAPLGLSLFRAGKAGLWRETHPILPTLTCCGHRCSQVPGQSCGLSSLLGEQLPRQCHWNQPSLHSPGLAWLLCQHEMGQSLSEDSLPKHTADSDEIEVQAPFVPCKCWRVPKRVHDGTNLNGKIRPF